MPEQLLPFSGKHILITAGPTREAIDPVRYISNHSSGKMGYALAQAFLDQGAEVVLVSGPVVLQLTHPRLRLIPAESAQLMYSTCQQYFRWADIAVFTAAVADYRPEKAAETKLKKNEAVMELRLVKNPDIAAEFGKLKSETQLSIGFALETNDELENARLKLNSKNFDLIVLNSMNDPGATFGFETNKIRILSNDGSDAAFSLRLKTEAALDILESIGKHL